mmetsp:Transcript_23212/g.66512  ORF Transcript_23212/g.66512 Transcript_23212/m.66512 type:complete len:86 (+) Transcript_23212:936-1193(+)
MPPLVTCPIDPEDDTFEPAEHPRPHLKLWRRKRESTQHFGDLHLDAADWVEYLINHKSEVLTHVYALPRWTTPDDALTQMSWVFL